MTDDRSSDLLSALPRSRPHRRSEKRPAREAANADAETREDAATPAKQSPTRRATTKSGRSEAQSPRSTAQSPRSTAKSPRSTAKSTRSPAKSPQAAKSSAAKSSAAKSRPAAKSTAAKPTAATRGTTKSAAGPVASPRRGQRLPQPAQPRGVPRGRGRRPEPTTDFPVLRTAVQAAAELTEIGFTLSAKALRGAISRLPRP